MSGSTPEPLETVRSALTELGVDWTAANGTDLIVTMPGERKLKTTCVLRVGQRQLDLHAFVVRRPEENAEGVHRFLLERNLRLHGIAFCVDHLGDIHLVGSLPAEALSTERLDQLLGEVLTASDENFNRLLELGFAGSIRRERAWRESRGESTRNLEAFRHLS